MGFKPTTAQYKERLYTIYSMLLDSYDRFTILEYARKTWGEVGTSTVDNYIKRANEYIEQDYKEKRFQKLRRSIAKRYKLKTRAIKKGDFNLAHEIQKDIDKLEGLYPSEKHHVTGKMTLSDFLRNENFIPKDSTLETD